MTMLVLGTAAVVLSPVLVPAFFLFLFLILFLDFVLPPEEERCY